MIGGAIRTSSRLTEKRRAALVESVRATCRVWVADGADLDDVSTILEDGVTAFLRDKGQTSDCRVEISGKSDA